MDQFQIYIILDQEEHIRNMLEELENQQRINQKKNIASARVNGYLLEGKKYDTADFGVENKLKSLVSRKYNTKVWDGKFTGREESMIPTKDLDIEKSANLIVLNSRKNKYPDLPFTVLRNTKKYPKQKDINRYKEYASKAKYNIDHHRGNTSGLAHEIGHVKNYESKNPITKVNNKVANKYSEEVANYDSFNENGSLLKGISNYFKQRALINEESNASKKAMRLLKKSGMNKDKLNNSKLDLDDSLKTYKYGGEVFYKTPIMKKIQIPSRRSSSNNRIRNHIEKLGGDPNSLHPDLRQNFLEMDL